MPPVEEIYGNGKQLMARLVLAYGKRTELRQGEPIPGTLFTISAITAREVKVADGNGQRTLAFY